MSDVRSDASDVCPKNSRGYGAIFLTPHFNHAVDLTGFRPRKTQTERRQEPLTEVGGFRASPFQRRVLSYLGHSLRRIRTVGLTGAVLACVGVFGIFAGDEAQASIGVVVAETALCVSRGHAFTGIHPAIVRIMRLVEGIVVANGAPVHELKCSIFDHLQLTSIENLFVAHDDAPIELSGWKHRNEPWIAGGAACVCASIYWIAEFDNCKADTRKSDVISGRGTEILADETHPPFIGDAKVFNISGSYSDIRPELPLARLNLLFEGGFECFVTAIQNHVLSYEQDRSGHDKNKSSNFNPAWFAFSLGLIAIGIRLARNFIAESYDSFAGGIGLLLLCVSVIWAGTWIIFSLFVDWHLPSLTSFNRSAASCSRLSTAAKAN